jgi:hypothetical protein
LHWLFSLLFFFFVTTKAWSQNNEPYEIELLRSGKKISALASPFWSGEYPLPVIDVFSGKPGKTKLRTFESVRDLNNQRDCTVKNGIYSPWSRKEHSALLFYSFTSLISYQVLAPKFFADTSLLKGDLIKHVAYLAEGQCTAKLQRAMGSKIKLSELVFSCDLAEKSKEFKKMGSKEDVQFAEQWLLLKCEEGYQSYIQDSTLLAHPGVKEGVIISFGEVGPQKNDQQK